MPAPAAAEGGGGGGRQRANPLWTVLRMGLMFYFFKNFFGGPTKQLPRAEMLVPKFERGLPLDMAVHITEAPVFTDFADTKSLVWSEAELPLATGGARTTSLTYHPSKAVQSNGSLWLHAVFRPSGVPLAPNDPDHDGTAVFVRSHPLVAFGPRPKRKTGVNLLSGAAAETRPAEELAAEAGPAEWIGFLKPNVTINLVDDFSAYPAQAVPEHMKAVVTPDYDRMSYFPPVFFNDFWLLHDKLIPLNSSVAEVQLHLTVSPLRPLFYMLYTQAEQSFSLQSSMGTLAEGEKDEFKRILLEGNPLFLGLTAAVSLLHSVFDALAFKNDIGFWRNKKNVEGLSIRTILINCFCQAVIFLYLLDNNTSFVVLLSAGVGTLIEFWKITKAVDITLDRSGGGLPRLRIADKAGYSDTKTKQYDKEAMRYLSYALYPLVIGYALYALNYETHKSWYSWVLNSLVGAVYTFGFILMCPQLYLNYRLKSVAHLPWRQMTYKFLNTIVDDLFAFVIKMPWLHRLSVFRDDLVFAVYIYQRWIYRVDRKRANEFGYSEEPGEEPAALAEGPAGASAAVAGSGDAQAALTEDTLRQRPAAPAAEAPAAAAGAGGSGAATGSKKDK